MIQWNITSNNKRKFLAVLTDIKLCEACINDLDMFQQYLLLVEGGKDYSKTFPSRIEDRIYEGIGNLNWGDYFEKMGPNS